MPVDGDRAKGNEHISSTQEASMSEITDFERKQIAAQALRDAADAMKYPNGAPYEVWASGAGNWLRERADAITTD